MAKRRTPAEDIATPEEVLRTFTQIMRGEMTESSGRKSASGEEITLPPKVSERSKAAEENLEPACSPSISTLWARPAAH